MEFFPLFTAMKKTVITSVILLALLLGHSAGQDVCTGPLAAITFTLTGGNFTGSTQFQDGKFDCDDFSGTFDKGVNIASSDAVVTPSMGLNVGDVVLLSAFPPTRALTKTKTTKAPSAGTKMKKTKSSDCVPGKLEEQTFIEISEAGAGGAKVQSLSIHTSCSRPLSVDDVFGALTVVDLCFDSP